MQRTRCNFSPKAPMHKGGAFYVLCVRGGLGEGKFSLGTEVRRRTFSSLLGTEWRMFVWCHRRHVLAVIRCAMRLFLLLRPCTLSRARNLSLSLNSELDRPTKKGRAKPPWGFPQTILIHRGTTEVVEKVRPRLRAARSGIHAP